MRRPPTRVGGALSSVGLVGCLALGGCTADDAGSAAPGTPTAPATTTSAAPTTPPAPGYVLPASCSALLTLGQLDRALGASLPGQTTYVVGEPQPSIGRTGRISCGFGVTPATDTAGQSDPLLELSVFTYTDATASAARLAATVQAQEEQGVRSETVPLPGDAGAGLTGVVLTSATDTTIVTDVGARTYSLTLVAGVLDPAATVVALQQLTVDVLAADGPAAATSSAPATG